MAGAAGAAEARERVRRALGFSNGPTGSWFTLGFWVVIVPLWMFVMVTAMPPLWWLLTAPRVRRRRRIRKGLCPTCGYDLRGSMGACPECGAGRVAKD